MLARKIILLFVVSVFVVAFIGCSNAGNTVAPPQEQINTDQRVSEAEGRVVWDTFRVEFNPENGTASIVPIRNPLIHVNVTAFTKPPKCYDCVIIGGSQYLPAEKEWHITVHLKNPSNMAAYDVRALVFNLGGKYLKNTDGFMNKYAGQDIDYKAYAKADPVRAFWPLAVNQQTFIFHFPPGENWNFVDYIVDASWPGNCKEPIVENLTFPDVLENGITVGTMTATAFDHQGEFFVVMADLTPIGMPPTALFDDGVHEDGDAGDGVFGAGGIMANCPEGDYMINVYAYDAGNHYGWNHTRVAVSGEIQNPPVISEITMSRTTVTKGSSSEKITLECIVENPDPNHQFSWSVTGGNLSVDDEAETVWSPPNTVGKYIATCEVSNGPQMDSMDSAKMRVTKYAIIGSAPAPDFTAKDCLGGPDVTLSDFCPGDAVLLNFWATWCGPCIAEMPHLQDVQDHYTDGDDFSYIAMSIDSTMGIVTSWINSNSYDFDYWLWDQGAATYNAYKPYVNPSGYIPTTLILDADRAVRYFKVGSISSPSVYTVVLDELV